MGNCFRRCLGEDSDSEYVGHGYGSQEDGGAGPIQYTVVGFTAVARDLLEFETTNKVPGLLGYYVSASKATQRIWYEKLLAAWKRANPAPASAEAVAVLLIQTLQGYHGIEGLLSFYHLPWPIVPVSRPVPEVPKPEQPKPQVPKPEAGGTWLVTPEAIKDIQFEIQTLPVQWKENEGDGDGLTVFVDVSKDARETKNLPKEIKDAVKGRRKARDPQTANAIRKKIQAANYKVFDGKNGQASCLAHKYKIRLRGVDAPEIDQPYGAEARDILRDLVKDQRLVIHVYNRDKYNRAVGDVYCRGMFIQEELLKKGSVWHYEFHDKREKFAKLERAAKAARLGLWADAHPEEPWDYRRRQKGLPVHNKNRGSFRKKRGA